MSSKTPSLRTRRATATSSADAEAGPAPPPLAVGVLDLPPPAPSPPGSDGGEGDGEGAALLDGGGGAPASSGGGVGGVGAAPRAVAPLDVAAAAADADATARALARRILPVFVALTAVNYLDRTAVAFAAPGLKASLGLTDAQYGLGSSAFFVGYCGAQLPLVAAALAGPGGPVPPLVAACVAWGAAAAATAFVTGPRSFYAARVVLGVAESASFPLMWAYLALFFAHDGGLGPAYAAVTATIAAAQVAGGPLAAALLSLGGGGRALESWQVLFIAQGAACLPVAAWAWRALPRSPAAVPFLPPDAARALAARHRAAAARAAAGARASGRWAALRSRRVWALGGLEAAVSAAKYALLFFAPLLVDALLTGAAVRHAAAGGGDGHAPPPAHRAAAVAALTAIPFGLAAASTVVNAHHSRRTGERRWHVVWPVAACAAGLAALGAALPRSAPAAMAALSLGLLVYAATGVVATYPASILTGDAAALGYALANAVGNAGGLAGPALFGALRDATGGYGAPCAALAAVAAVAAGLYAVTLPWLAPDDGPKGGAGSAARAKAGDGGSPTA